MKSPARALLKALVALVLMVTVLEALGYDVLGAMAGLLAASGWAYAIALIAIGFVAGRLLERAVRHRDLARRGASKLSS